ncbi:uncharacterized protein RJT21DRAFT_118423 [Scheffersomyces amazonensis]|uniref:uncharacterized protein n=1 Tax=Scheffersomyces amazonensis TaxID=1078765 RepID=UPI00315DD9B2
MANMTRWLMGLLPSILCNIAIFYGVVRLSEVITPSDATIPSNIRQITLIRSLALSIILPGILFLVHFMYDTLTMNWRCKRLQQYQYQYQYQLSFYLPLIEEFLKFSILFILTCISKLQYTQIGFVILALNTSEILTRYMSFESDKFLKLYDMFTHQEAFESKYSTDSKEEMHALFQSILNNEDDIVSNDINDNINDNNNYNRQSISSGNSEDTLFINKKVSMASLPSTFNLTKTEVASSSSLQNSNSIDSQNTVQTVDSIKILSNYKSCYDFVDKLYSVSPKNTYHLNTATAIAAFDNALSDNQPNINYDLLERVDHMQCTNVTLPSDDDELALQPVTTQDTHFGGGGGGNFKYKFPDGRKIEFGGGAGFDYSHSKPGSDSGSDSEAQHYQSPYEFKDNKFIRFINWFSWLVPPLLPISVAHKNEEVNQESTHLLKKRLSTFKISKRSQSIISTSTSIGTYYTGEQTNYYNTSNPIDRYKNFVMFINLFFDYSVDDFNSAVEIPLLFKRFGVIFNEFPIVFNLLDCFNFMAWNFITIMIYGTLFLSNHKSILIGMSVGLFIIKLFKINYLNNPNNRFGYKGLIATELFINSAGIFAICLLIIEKLGYLG